MFFTKAGQGIRFTLVGAVPCKQKTENIVPLQKIRSWACSVPAADRSRSYFYLHWLKLLAGNLFLLMLVMGQLSETCPMIYDAVIFPFTDRREVPFCAQAKWPRTRGSSISSSAILRTGEEIMAVGFSKTRILFILWWVASSRINFQALPSGSYPYRL